MAGTGVDLEVDGFWSTVRKRSREALSTGALQPVSTRSGFVEEDGVEFTVRVSDNLRRKRDVPGSYDRPAASNPFVPPDPALTVGSLLTRHLAVLNKFNVLQDHVLVITRGFVHQETALAATDFSAASIGLARDAGLAFYNSGRTAGASQPHRHFQLVPLPLGRVSDIPIAVLLDSARDGIDAVPRLRFRHAYARVGADVNDPAGFGRACHALYRDALAGLGLSDGVENNEAARLPPYNLLLTREWMLIVPRRVEHYRRISINGLGYAGSLFVTDTGKLAQVEAEGPMRILERVSRPPKTS